MRFPNKINTYKSTVIHGMVRLYAILKEPCSTSDLLRKARREEMDGKDVMDALLCLYAARKIEFDIERQEIKRC